MKRWRSGRKLRIMCSLTLFTGLFAVPFNLVLPVQSAWATSCSGFSSNGYREGYTSATWNGSEPMVAEGTLDYLNNPQGDILCSGDARGGYNWVAAWNGTFAYGGNSGWAQSGTMYRYGWTCVENWAQTSQNGSSWTNWWWNNYLCNDNGVDEYYNYPYWNGSSYQEVVGFLDKSSHYHTAIAPFSMFAWAYPFSAEYASESDYPVNHIPGTASNPEVNSFLHIMSFSNDNWYDDCGNINLGPANPSPAIWNEYAQRCDHFTTWTS